MTNPADIEKLLTQLNLQQRKQDAMKAAIRQTIGNLADEAEALREVLGDDYPIILKDASAASDWFSEQHDKHGCEGP